MITYDELVFSCIFIPLESQRIPYGKTQGSRNYI